MENVFCKKEDENDLGTFRTFEANNRVIYLPFEARKVFWFYVFRREKRRIGAKFHAPGYLDPAV